MAIETQEAITGFIATEPRLSYTDQGVPRLYCRIGIEHSRQEPDGSFTALNPTFHDMTAFRKAAEEGVSRFRKGDKFVATGRTHEYAYEKDGQSIQAEEFVVSRFGHDIARTDYEVDRTPRRLPVTHGTPQREAVGLAAAPTPHQSSVAPTMGM